MRLNTGFFDSLFGKKITLHVPQQDGTTKAVQASEAWLRKMKNEGKMIDVDPPESAEKDLERAIRIQRSCHTAFEQARRRLPQFVSGELRRRIVFWLADFPQTMFDTVFAVDASGQSYVPVLLHAETEEGAVCAAITQAYSLWLLEQLLANDPVFRDNMEFDMPEVERIVATALPITVLDMLKNYRSRFDLEKLEIDPRDWDIVWLWDVADTLIQTATTLKQAMGPWNDDVLARTEYSAQMAALTLDLKAQALSL